MSGTIDGGHKAAQTNRRLYGSSFYVKIGGMGGKWKGPKGFAKNRKLASIAGKKGGQISKRRPSFI